MTAPVHFDVEAMRRRCQAAFDAIVPEARAGASCADDRELIDLQVRFFPLMLAFTCAIAEARNAGHDGSPLAQAVGSMLGQAVQNALCALPPRLREECADWMEQAQADFWRDSDGAVRTSVTTRATPGGHA